MVSCQGNSGEAKHLLPTGRRDNIVPLAPRKL